jgi:predicted transcriptional regulator
MSNQTSLINPTFLKSALDRHLQLVTPNISVREIIEGISHLNASCPLFASKNYSDLPDSPGANMASGYMLVVSKSAISAYPDKPTINPQNMLKISDILGIVTVPDILQAIADEKHSLNLTVADVMNRNLIAIPQAESEDIFSIATLWRQSGIYPILVSDASGFFLGAIAPSKIVQHLESDPWLKWHSVKTLKNVLHQEVITASLKDSLEKITKLMQQNQAIYVVICEDCKPSKTAIAQPENLRNPVGIVTDQDIVNFLAIDLDLSRIKAENVINHSLPAIGVAASLWSDQKSMQQWQTSALLVSSDRGEFMGVIDQTSWLKTLDPAEMYRTIAQLQQNLESKTEALNRKDTELQAEIAKRRNAETTLEIIQKDLESYVAECTAELKVANEQLKKEILHQQEVETGLRKSEAESREQARQLEIAIEKLQKTQAKLIQMEKMSGLGQLVAGIAHEINNPINFIYGNITHASTYIKDMLNILNIYQNTYPNPSQEIEKLIE